MRILTHGKAQGSAPKVLITVTSSDEALGAVTGGGYYNIGQTVNLDAFVLAVGEFVNWTEGGVEVSTDETYTFTASVNRTIVGNFCGPVEASCECVMEFDFYEPNPISVLSVGNLTGLPCDISEGYVIDWTRDGVHELVSGVGSDPEIEAYHPFIGQASIPVLPGEWIPTVRYVIIDGVAVYGKPVGCETWCELIDILPVVIVVAPLDCTSILNPSGTYNFRLNYISTNDYALASRKLRFNLDADLKYLAIKFDGYTVADEIEVLFNNITPIYSAIIGSQLNPSDWDSIPKALSISASTKIFEFPEYTEGDHIIIKITPSVRENNTNTNWLLSINCLGEEASFNCEALTSDYYKIETVRMEYNNDTCSYRMIYKPKLYFNDLVTSSGAWYWIDRYGLTIQANHNNYVYPITSTKEYYADLPYNKVRDNTTIYQSQPTKRANSNGMINYKKVGNVIEITFSHPQDYDDAYQSWLLLEASIFRTEFINDNTKYEYYKHVILPLQLSELGCGDQYTSLTITLHPTTEVVFNGTNKVTFTTSSITNAMTPIACDNTYTTIEKIITQVNNTHNYANYNYNSLCNLTQMFGYAFSLRLEAVNNTLNNFSGYVLRFSGDNEGIPCSNSNGLMHTISNGRFGILKYGIKVIITATIDSNNEYTQDPIENYEVYRLIGDDGKIIPGGTLIYKIVGGVETVNDLSI